jgi:protein ImuA
VAAVRDGTPSAVIADVSQMPMVATRRLQLVAADADIPVLTLRCRRNREQDLLADPARLVDVVAGGSGADAVFRTRAC